MDGDGSKTWSGAEIRRKISWFFAGQKVDGGADLYDWSDGERRRFCEIVVILAVERFTEVFLFSLLARSVGRSSHLTVSYMLSPCLMTLYESTKTR